MPYILIPFTGHSGNNNLPLGKLTFWTKASYLSVLHTNDREQTTLFQTLWEAAIRCFPTKTGRIPLLHDSAAQNQVCAIVAQLSTKREG